MGPSFKSGSGRRRPTFAGATLLEMLIAEITASMAPEEQAVETVSAVHPGIGGFCHVSLQCRFNIVLSNPAEIEKTYSM